ncbi:MAG: hypothetical protein RBT72_03655 [Spirochaetia bacterium]|jgi:hypothetical protein|nr:hypothetical protein [Spirochaetales bacterium]MDX9783830.1 hypothetical protein [Spirochaetia bacterium]
MKITYKTLGIVVVAAIVVGIAGAKVAGLWKTEGTKQPVAIREGEFSGMPNPSDIRGSYTWNDVAEAFGFDVGLLLKAFGAADPLLKLNTLETVFEGIELPEGTEIGTDAVKLFVSLLTGLPHVAEETTILPFSAIEILKEEGKASPELIEEAAQRAWIPNGAAATPEAEPTIPAAEVTPPSSTSTVGATSTTTTTTITTISNAIGTTSSTTVHTPSPAKTSGTGGDGTGAVAGTIVGKTTFKDLKTWGLTEDQIKSVTGGEIGHDLAAIRDWATSKGLSFSELKASLQALLDAGK